MEVSESLAFFPLVPMFPFFYDVAIYILGGGIVVGAIGSTISLKQYMRCNVYEYKILKSRLVATILTGIVVLGTPLYIVAEDEDLTNQLDSIQQQVKSAKCY